MDHIPEVSGIALDTVFHTKFNIHLVKCPMYIDHLDPLGFFTTIFGHFWSSTMITTIITLFVVPICLKTSSIAPSSSFWENTFLPRMPWYVKTSKLYFWMQKDSYNEFEFFSSFMFFCKHFRWLNQGKLWKN